MEYAMLMEFTDQSQNFSNGFEAGRIWEIIKSGEAIDQMYCQASNCLQIKNMCELFSCDYTIEPVNEHYILLNIFATTVERKITPIDDKQNP